MGRAAEVSRPLRLGYISDAAEGMPFAVEERAGVEALGYEVVEIRACDTRAEECGRPDPAVPD